MKRANPADLRKAAEVARHFEKAGILYVPVPVLNTQDATDLQRQVIERLDLQILTAGPGTE